MPPRRALSERPRSGSSEQGKFGVSQTTLNQRKLFGMTFVLDAQQAAKKSIKAVLVHRKIDFPKTHNIRALLELVDPTGSQISKEIWQAINLTS
jgi:HEPN domain